MSEYDERQYRAMAEQLTQYRQHAISLDHLISGLDALLSLLEQPDRAWKAAFRSEWGTLEVEHAVALDQGRSQLPVESQQRVHAAVSRLSQLLASRIGAESLPPG
jgi:hypothetical protein